MCRRPVGAQHPLGEQPLRDLGEFIDPRHPFGTAGHHRDNAAGELGHG